MPVFRMFPIRDTWITTALEIDGITHASGSNFGASPTLNIFANKTNGTPELARALLQFSLTELSGKIYNDKTIPSSSVIYKMKIFNKITEDPVPQSCDLQVFPLSASWDEGIGIDNDNYTDVGVANWVQASSTQNWVLTGSDYYTSVSASYHLDQGNEDPEMDVTNIVSQWLNETILNNGVVIKLTDLQEQNGISYYRKAISGRETKYVDRIPYIEAQWDDTRYDNRNNFGFDIDNNLYMHNFIRGQYQNVVGPVYVRVQDSLNVGTYQNVFTASQVSIGLFSASINIPSGQYSASFHDIWYTSSRVLMTGTFHPIFLSASNSVSARDNYVVGIGNLKREYSNREEATIRVSLRNPKYRVHVGHSASFDVNKEYVENIYYSILNNETREVIIPFATGSLKYTRLSYDENGNYFRLNMNPFVPGFSYRVQFLIDNGPSNRQLVDNEFIFRVID